MIIYALVNGFLDDIPVQDVQRFEAEIISWTKNNAPEILDEIKTKGTLPDKEKMNSAIENFKRSFSISEE